MPPPLVWRRVGPDVEVELPADAPLPSEAEVAAARQDLFAEFRRRARIRELES